MKNIQNVTDRQKDERTDILWHNPTVQGIMQ